MKISSLPGSRPLLSGPLRRIHPRIAVPASFVFMLLFSAVRAEITAPVRFENDRFGQAVAVTKLPGGFRLIAVGAPGIPSVPAGLRNVRIFVERGENTFPPYASEFTIPSAAADPVNADFGARLAMRTAADGSVLLAVGAPSEGSSRGAVHLYRRTTLGAWTQIQTLLAPVRAAGDNFGGSIAISEDLQLIAVGAPQTDAGGQGAAGAVYAYRLIAGVYQFSATASAGLTPTSGARVGTSVSVPKVRARKKPEILVGSSGAGQGAVHVLRENSPGSWTRAQTIAAPVGTTGEGFGSALAASEALAVVGMSDANAAGNPGRGTAFALVRARDGAWSIDTELPFAGEIAQTANLGASVAMSGLTIVVGSERGEAAHVFRRGRSGAWLQAERITVPPAEGGRKADAFGRSVALDGGLMVAGCPQADGARGSINLFECDPARLTAVRPTSGGRFGTACAINGARAAFGAVGETTLSSATEFVTGAIRVMNFVDGVWEHEADLTNPNEGAFVDFGRRLAMPTPELIVATAPGDSSVSNTRRGIAYLYERAAPGVWSRTTINSPDDTFSNFGAGLAAVMDGGVPLIAFGATSLVAPGRVHIMAGTQFVQVLENPSPGNDDNFGAALAMNRYSDGTIDLWVGAPGDDTSSASTAAL